MGICETSNNKKIKTKKEIENYPNPKPNFVLNNDNKYIINYYYCYNKIIKKKKFFYYIKYLFYFYN